MFFNESFSMRPLTLATVNWIYLNIIFRNLSFILFRVANEKIKVAFHE